MFLCCLSVCVCVRPWYEKFPRSVLYALMDFHYTVFTRAPWTDWAPWDEDKLIYVLGSKGQRSVPQIEQICEKYQFQGLFLWYIRYTLTDFLSIFVARASWDIDLLISWGSKGQRSRSSGSGIQSTVLYIRFKPLMFVLMFYLRYLIVITLLQLASTKPHDWPCIGQLWQNWMLDELSGHPTCSW